MRPPLIQGIEWDDLAIADLARGTEEAALRNLMEREAVFLLKETGVYGLLPTPLVPIAAQLEFEVAVERLGYEDGSPRTHIGGWLEQDAVEGRIVINEQLWVQGRREVLAHECGHARLDHHLSVEARIEVGGVSNVPFLRAQLEHEADMFSLELQFQGPVFRRLLDREQLCLATPLRMAESDFFVFPDDVAFRYAIENQRPCALLELSLIEDTLLVERATWSPSFTAHVNLRELCLSSDPVAQAPGYPSGPLGRLVASVLAHPTPGYYAAVGKHEVLNFDRVAGRRIRLAACVKALGFNGRALVMLSLPQEHGKRKRVRPLKDEWPQNQSAAKLLARWLSDPLMNFEVLSQFQDLHDQRLQIGLNQLDDGS